MNDGLGARGRMELPRENVFGHTKKIRLVLGSLARLRTELGRGLEVLDVGCGNGSALTRFLGEPGDRVLGIDEHVESIEYARRWFGSEVLSFRVQRAEELSGEPSRFDVVVLADVLEHLEEPQKLLDEVSLLLRPGGAVLATIPNGWGPFEIESRVSRLPLFGRASLRIVDYFVAFLNRLIFRGAWTCVVALPGAVPYNIESAHVQFFSWRKLAAMARHSGLKLRRLAHLSWLSGPYTNYLWAPSRRFCEWNTRVADSLPRTLVSAWFFEFGKTAGHEEARNLATARTHEAAAKVTPKPALSASWTNPGLPFRKIARLAFQSLIGLFFLGALFVVLFLPYRAWDALSYGEWSRLIAQTGDYHFPTVTELMYQRPLFYVGQGWLWRLLGYHNAIGRAFGLLFGVLLAFAAWRLSKQICPERLGLVPYVCLSLLIAIPGVSEQICSGLADVPVAAMVACVGAALWTLPVGARASSLVCLLSCFAVLAKPSALPALVGLGLAHSIGPKIGLGRRILFGCLPLVAGMGLGLLYDMEEAHRCRMTLSTFLTGPLSGYYEKLSASARFGAFWDWSWLGPSLRFPVLLAVCYGGLRIPGVAHGRALRIAALGALFMSWFGPWIATGRLSFRAGLFAPGHLSRVSLLAVALLVGVCLIPQRDSAVSRINLMRLIVWAIPVCLSWLLYAAYDTRLLSACWAPLALLILGVVAPPVVTAFQRFRWIGGSGLLAILLLASGGLPQLDGLGREGWRVAVSGLAAGRFRANEFSRSLSPDLAEILDVLSNRVRPNERLFTPDGRLRFFFPGRVGGSYPRSCRDLAGYDYFVLPRGARMESYFRAEVGVPGTPDYWGRCAGPSLDLVVQTQRYAVFRVAKPA